MSAAPLQNKPAREVDVLIIGSGAGGLSAAVTAAFYGKKVLVIEKESTFGGATAWSGGWMWTPVNPLAKRDGIVEDLEAPRTYLRHELGNHYDSAKVEAFLNGAGRMVGFFEDNTALQFISGSKICDIHGDTPGAGTGGRSVVAAPYDARKLGPLLAKLRLPMRETTLLGMGIQAGPDLYAFMNATRSLKNFAYVSRRFGRHLFDLAFYRRATQLVNGNALIARLARSAADLDVEIMVSAPAKRLVLEEGQVCGAIAETSHGECTIRAKAVVLATGGFPHDRARRKALFPHVPTGAEHYSVTPPACNGDGLTLGEQVGALVDTSLAAAAAWCPVSLVPFADGTIGHYPHIIERAKPGLIAVLKNGQRFVNEANGYYDFVSAMLRATKPGEEACSWLIATRGFARRYGFGIAKPFPVPMIQHLRSGYIKQGNSIAELAATCGIDANGLAETLKTYNTDVKTGIDSAFGRGSTPFNRAGGDATVKPNPCLAPIESGPFYAIKVVPGSFGTFAGLKTDPAARALGTNGAPIPGLYAVGADMASVMGGFYPAGGINLGPAMTFGYLAGLNIAGRQ